MNGLIVLGFGLMKVQVRVSVSVRDSVSVRVKVTLMVTHCPRCHTAHECYR